VKVGGRWVHLGKADVGNDWSTVREKNALAEAGYTYGFETKNGVKAAEAGRIEERGTADESLRSEGYYQMTGDDGVVYRVDYVAVANGYVNDGKPIPKPQSAIVRALEYISKNPNVQW
jgi:Insect cuticle protein